MGQKMETFPYFFPPTALKEHCEVFGQISYLDQSGLHRGGIPKDSQCCYQTKAWNPL